MIRLYELECSQRHVGIWDPNGWPPQICDPFKSWALCSYGQRPRSRMKLYGFTRCEVLPMPHRRWWQGTVATAHFLQQYLGIGVEERWCMGFYHDSLDKLLTVTGVFCLVLLFVGLCLCISWPWFALFRLKHLIVSAQVPKVCSWFGFHKVQECPAWACCHISQRGIA